MVGSKKRILRYSNNPDRRSRIRGVNRNLGAMSNNDELPAARRNKVMSSVVPLGKDRRAKLRTRQSAHKKNAPSSEGAISYPI